MRGIRRLSMVVAISMLTFAVAVPAQAGSELKDSAVSCDAKTIKTVGTIWPLIKSRITVQQRHATTHASTSIVWLRDSLGNETGKGRISNGEAVAWANMPAATWQVRALRSAPKNCNGALPGKGNYHLYLVVSHS